MSLYFHIKESPFTQFSESEAAVMIENYELFKKKGKLEDSPNKRLMIQHLFLAMLYGITGIFQKHVVLNSKKKSRKEELFEQFVNLVFLNFREQKG